MVNSKKDLNIILEDLNQTSNLDNTILIDDNPGYIATGQESNFFLIDNASPGDLFLAYEYYSQLLTNTAKEQKQNTVTLKQFEATPKNKFYEPHILSHYKLLYVTYQLNLALNKYNQENKSFCQSIPKTPFPRNLTKANLKIYKEGLEILKPYIQESEFPEIEDMYFSDKQSVNIEELLVSTEVSQRISVSKQFRQAHSPMSMNCYNLKAALKQTKNLFQKFNPQNCRTLLYIQNILYFNLEKDYYTNKENISYFRETGLLKQHYDEKIVIYCETNNNTSKNNLTKTAIMLNRIHELDTTLKHTVISSNSLETLRYFIRFANELKQLKYN